MSESIKMNIKDVSNELLSRIHDSFKEFDFVLNKSQSEFKRNVNDCTQIVDLFFYKKGQFITIKPEIRIKEHQIEKIYRAVSQIKDRPYLTLGNHLFEIVKYIDHGIELDDSEEEIRDWLVEDEDDISKLVEIIPKYLKATILPYFDQNSSISRVDELLNKYPRELSIHNVMYPLRANIAIIAAKLNHNPKFDELVEIYDEELLDAEETYREEFVRLKRELK